MSLLEKFFGTHSEREVKRVMPVVNKVLSYEEELSKLSDKELKDKTKYFKDRLRAGDTLEDILPEAFATVREAAWRTLGMKPFPVQVIGGIILHQGRIAELATGEGKSLPCDTKIPTPLGWVKAKDVKLGDYLFDADGNTTKVVGVYPQGKLQNYLIRFEDGRSIKCSLSHLWTIYCENCEKTLTTEEIINLLNTGKEVYLPMAKAVEYSTDSKDVVEQTEFSAVSDVMFRPLLERERFATEMWLHYGRKISGKELYEIPERMPEDKVKDFKSLLQSLGWYCESVQNSNAVIVEKNKDKLQITSIVALNEEEEHVCFKVENERHLFLAGDFIVTHNTLTATMPAYLNALSGKGVFVITVNDYLAERDSLLMGKVYSYLGLKTGLITHPKTIEERRQAYNCDITYGTNNEIGFDYLKDNMVTDARDRVQRGFNYCIVDEVDSVLIDDSRTPLIISGMGDKGEDGYIVANEFVKRLKGVHIKEVELGNKFELAIDSLLHNEFEEQYGEYDYIVEDKSRAVSLTSKGTKKAEQFFGISNYADIDNQEIAYYVERALKAHGIFHRDTDYIVRNGEVLIVDESTGRIMEGRRYSDGIHQAIEAKEGVNIRKESKTLASITFQNFFRKFKKLSGMTGTALTEEAEFRNVYGLDVVSIPTNKPIARIDLEDEVYIKRDAKLRAIVNRIKEVHATGQPLLVGTISVDKSEELSKLLDKEKIPHNVLNAKHHEKEAYIIAQAGKEGSVTISTNMAGRGTDIMLGGNADYLAVEDLRSEGYSEELISEAQSHAATTNDEIIRIRSLYKDLVERHKQEIKPHADKVRALGGLYVLGTERHESRRIDNQLKGRSGRQGDPGVSEFYVSLEDDLMKLFASNKAMDILTSLDIPDDTPIGMKMVSDAIERAQQNIETTHAAQRSNTLEYDEVVAKQREVIYNDRNKILDEELDYSELILQMAKNTIPKKVSEIINLVMKTPEKEGDDTEEELTQECILSLIREFEKWGAFISIKRYKKSELSEKDENNRLVVTSKTISANLVEQVKEAIAYLEDKVETKSLKRFQKHSLLMSLDRSWQNHMVDLDSIKQGIGLQSYGQKKPIEEFQFESFNLFNAMIDEMQYRVVEMNMLFASKAQEREEMLENEGKI